MCIGHAEHGYDSLGAVLQVAATNRARDGWRKRQFERCAVDEELPAPGPLPTRTPGSGAKTPLSRQRSARKTRHARDPLRKLIEGEEFATIGRALRMTEEAAKWTYNNALKRIRKCVHDDGAS